MFSASCRRQSAFADTRCQRCGRPWGSSGSQTFRRNGEADCGAKLIHPLALRGRPLTVTTVLEAVSFTEQTLESPLIGRLNLGPVNTMNISSDKPHEGKRVAFHCYRHSIEGD